MSVAETWSFYYRCRLCGAVFRGAGGSKFTTFHTLVEMTARENVESVCAPAGRYDLHDCKDGRQGFADIIGRADTTDDTIETGWNE